MSNLIFEEALKELNELDDDDFVDPDAAPVTLGMVQQYI